MKLIIDIGNTSTKVAIFKNKLILRQTTLKSPSLALIKDFVSSDDIQSSIISTVKNFTDAVLEIKHFYNSIIFNEYIKVPIENKYKTSNTLGYDRLAGVIGATYLFPKKDILIFDSGTCLTVDFINLNKQYLGGRISPGIEMRLKALNTFTNKLPLLSKQKTYKFMGNDTNSSIISGVYQGIIAEVNSVISYYLSCNSETIIILTGGDYLFFEKELKNSIFAYPNLVLCGLNEILDYNE